VIVISRQLSEKVIVGSIVITVVDIHNDVVRLGIEAPRDVPVYRVDAAHETPPDEQRRAA
jgi:carbon storage regulator